MARTLASIPAALMAVTLVLLLVGCGTKDNAALATPAGLTFADVQRHAVVAVSVPGKVFHSKMSASAGSQNVTQNVWVFADKDTARSEYQDGQGLTIYHEGKRADLSPEKRFEDSPLTAYAWSPKTSLQALGYLTQLEATDTADKQIFLTRLDGADVTLLQFSRPVEDDVRGTEHYKLYLDRSWLPVREDSTLDAQDGPDRRYSVRVENEFLDPTTLAKDFFSPELLRAQEVTTADHIAEAKAKGIDAYWLGQQFEEMPLKDAQVNDRNGVATLNITYEHEAADRTLGVTIDEYSAADWNKLPNTGKRWWESDSPTLRRVAVTVLGATGTFYDDPNASRPTVKPPPGSEPTPTTPFASWRSTALIVRLGDTVILIQPNGGPIYQNPYREREGLVRTANGLRRFVAPAH